jgi:surface carbohydrate biosynthesis protein
VQVPADRRKWLVFPVVNFVREFYGKLLLAAVAAERGWGVILAYKGYFKHDFPTNTGVAVDMILKAGPRISNFLERGWHLSGIDEEGLIYQDGDDYVHRRVDESIVRQMDYVFLWGENQRNDITKHIAGIEDKLVVSGNPRFDLLRPELRQFYAPKAAQITGKYGRYILINTNFGYANHYFRRDYVGLRALKREGKVTTKEQELDQIGRQQHQERIMQAFLNMLPILSQHFPDHRIIIRPHPSENFGTWVEAAERLPNVLMIHEGDVVPWLLGAEAVVHNSCTTGVQAYLLDRPVVSFMPQQSDQYDPYLPNAVGQKVQTVEQLIGLLTDIVSDRASPKDEEEEHRRLITRNYVAALDGPWASERIMDEIEKLDVDSQVLEPDIISAIKKHMSARTRAKERLSTLRAALRQRLSGRTSAPSPGDGSSTTYTRQRWPGVTLEQVREPLRRLRSITGRFSNVDVCLAADDWVCVFPSGD